MPKEESLGAAAGDFGREMAGKYLTFKLASEEYGIKIEKVREIIGVLDVTPVPHTNDFVMGVINLRGKVIPVINLRTRFSLEFRPFDERTCTIVLETFTESGANMLLGIVVDQVSEVINLRGEDIDPAPSFGVNLNISYIMGVAKSDGAVKILLDIDRVFLDRKLVREF